MGIPDRAYGTVAGQSSTWGASGLPSVPLDGYNGYASEVRSGPVGRVHSAGNSSGLSSYSSLMPPSLVHGMGAAGAGSRGVLGGIGGGGLNLSGLVDDYSAAGAGSGSSAAMKASTSSLLGTLGGVGVGAGTDGTYQTDDIPGFLSFGKGQGVIPGPSPLNSRGSISRFVADVVDSPDASSAALRNHGFRDSTDPRFAREEGRR